MEGMNELLNRIENSGMVVPDYVREAMCSLHLEQFTSYDHECFFHDRPVVFMETKNGGVKTISAPHMIVTLLYQLELSEGQEVLILGSKGGYLAALIATILGEDGRVLLLDPSEEIIRHTAKALSGWPTIDVRTIEAVEVAPIETPGDLNRIVVTGGITEIPMWMQNRIVENGFVIAPIGEDRNQELMKIERQGNELFPTSLGPVSFGPVDIIESEPEPLTALEIADLIETLIETCHEMELCDPNDLYALGELSDQLRLMEHTEHDRLEEFIVENMQQFVHLWPMFQLMLAPSLARPGDVDGDNQPSGPRFDEFKP